MQEKNPFLEPENFFEGYQKNIEDLKNNAQVVDFDRLCFELFERNEQGKRFLELITERYLIPTLAHPDSPTYTNRVMWAEGFKEFGRMLVGSIKSHQQRIKAGNN